MTATVAQTTTVAGAVTPLTTAPFGSSPPSGDVVLTFVDSDTTMTSGPSGATQRATFVGNQGTYVYDKTAGASEPTTVTVTPNGSGNATTVACLDITGTSGFDAVSAVADTQGSAQTSRTITSFTTAAGNGDLVIAAVLIHGWSGSTPTTPVWNNGFTALLTAGPGAQFKGTEAIIFIATKQVAASTAVGTTTVTWTNSAQDTTAWHIGYQAASGGGGAAGSDPFYQTPFAPMFWNPAGSSFQLLGDQTPATPIVNGIAVPAASVSVAVSAVVEQLATAAPAAVVAVGAAAFLEQLGAAAPAAQVGVSSAALATAFGTAAPAATVGVVAGGVVTQFGSATPAAQVSVAAAGTATAFGSAAPAAVVSVTAAAVVTQLGAAAPAASVSVTAGATVTQLGSAVPAAVVAVATSGTVTALGAAVPAAVVSVAAAGAVTAFGTAVPAAAVSVATSGTVTQLGAAAPAAVVSVAASGTSVAPGAGAAAPTAVVAVGVSGLVTQFGTATPAAVASVATGGIVTQFAAASPAAVVAVITSGVVGKIGAAGPTATVSVTTSGTVTQLGAASPGAQVSVTASAGGSTGGAASPAATVAVSTTGTVTQLGAASPAAAITVLVGGTVTAANSAAPQPHITITTTATVTQYAAAAPAAVVTVVTIGHAVNPYRLLDLIGYIEPAPLIGYIEPDSLRGYLEPDPGGSMRTIYVTGGYGDYAVLVGTPANGSTPQDLSGDGVFFNFTATTNPPSVWITPASPDQVVFQPVVQGGVTYPNATVLVRAFLGTGGHAISPGFYWGWLKISDSPAVVPLNCGQFQIL